MLANMSQSTRYYDRAEYGHKIKINLFSYPHDVFSPPLHGIRRISQLHWLKFCVESTQRSSRLPLWWKEGQVHSSKVQCICRWTAVGQALPGCSPPRPGCSCSPSLSPCSTPMSEVLEVVGFRQCWSDSCALGSSQRKLPGEYPAWSNYPYR